MPIVNYKKWKITVTFTLLYLRHTFYYVCGGNFFTFILHTCWFYDKEKRQLYENFQETEFKTKLNTFYKDQLVHLYKDFMDYRQAYHRKLRISKSFLFWDIYFVEKFDLSWHFFLLIWWFLSLHLFSPFWNIPVFCHLLGPPKDHHEGRRHPNICDINCVTLFHIGGAVHVNTLSHTHTYKDTYTCAHTHTGTHTHFHTQTNTRTNILGHVVALNIFYKLWKISQIIVERLER